MTPKFRGERVNAWGGLKGLIFIMFIQKTEQLIHYLSSAR